MPWRRKWQPIPVFLPGEFREHRSLAGCSPWSCKESDMAERHTHTHTYYSLSLYLLISICFWPRWSVPELSQRGDNLLSLRSQVVASLRWSQWQCAYQLTLYWLHSLLILTHFFLLCFLQSPLKYIISTQTLFSVSTSGEAQPKRVYFTFSNFASDLIFHLFFVKEIYFGKL